MKRAIRALVLAVPLLFVIQAVTAGLVLPAMPQPAGGSMGWILASSALTALLLAGLGLRLTVRGVPRAAILFLIAAGIPLNNLVEALYFSLDIPKGHLGPLFVNALAVGGLFVLALEALLGAPATGPEEPSGQARGRSWALRIGGCALAYVLFYFAAGRCVWPFVRHFYEARPMPGAGLVLIMQVFRGLVFTSMALVLARNLAASRVMAALATGLTLSLLGGVAPLLLPNPYMPDSIRFPHMVEVGVSNLLFGCLAGWVLGRAGEAQEGARAAA